MLRGCEVIREELVEVEEALESGSEEEVSMEIGDLLFAVRKKRRWETGKSFRAPSS